MAFSDFSFPQVQDDLGLTFTGSSLFAQVSPIEASAGFAAFLSEGVKVAISVDTEKARSEFIIAPVLLELRRLLGGEFALFSGVELNVDPARGLTGVCDFILSKSKLQYVLTVPLVAIVEAKNDNVRYGFGQCIASMVAAATYNEQHGTPLRAVYGAATTGTAWKFLRLEGTVVMMDDVEYYIDNPGKILGILKHILETA